jgi:hypothetical protein
MVVEAGRRISEASEEVQGYVESYNARRYRHVNTEVTDEQDTNIISYDEPPTDKKPTPSLVQGELEIEKIFDENFVEKHI